MKERSGAYQLKIILRRYQLLLGLEVLLWSLAIGLAIFFALQVFIELSTIPALAAFIIAGVSALFGMRRLRVFEINEQMLAHHLNRKYPVLKDSADLLLRNAEDLTTIQQLQQARTLAHFQEIYSSINVPHRIGRAAGVLTVSIVLSAALASFVLKLKTPRSTNDHRIESTVPTLLPAAVGTAQIVVSPPAYTEIPNYVTTDLNLKFPEGSTLKWQISFKGEVTRPEIVFSQRDSIAFVSNSTFFEVKQTFTESGFYQLIWRNEDGTAGFSDYYKLDVTRDSPPSIMVKNPEPHTEVGFADRRKINLAAMLSDDYGLNDAYIIATVSKGSGEAIKFREEKLYFDQRKEISGKAAQMATDLDLSKLGLEPGDELYFYVEALDIKKPNANRSRTDTYFITLLDTASLINTAEASLGVDLMPEYFRSQRQIIIDTEKLLRQKKGIPLQHFNERSNGLAHDQKVLRLRYGQFLGEEFESGLSSPAALDNERSNEDVQKKFGHEHDREHSNSHLDEKNGGEENHSHGGAQSHDEKKQDPLKEFIHDHDNEEQANFFVQSIRTKLKAAITIMWDAELYLRLYQPQKSLPYQYKALKLLKEISQDSRIYVHRTGFDPPPLKEEKRLTGDLSEIKSSTSNFQTLAKESYTNIRAAISVIEDLRDADNVVLTEVRKNILINAGREVASLELKKPGTFLQTLGRLSRVVQNEIKPEERRNVLLQIQASLLTALPPETANPNALPQTIHALDSEFLKGLDMSIPNN